MTANDIKPIPEKILNIINKLDLKYHPAQNGFVRFYSYLVIRKGELIKITVAVKNYNKRWYCKQVAAHAVHDDICFVRDIEYCWFGMGYRIDWYKEGIQNFRKFFESPNWETAENKYYDPWAYVVNMDIVGKLPQYKYSGYQNYHGRDIISYLRLYERYPQAEYLLKFKLVQYAESIQILRLIEKDKNFCKWLIKNRELLIDNQFYIDVILRAYKTGRDINELQAIKKVKLYFIHDDSTNNLKELFKGKDLEQLLLYLVKHNVSLELYKDYYHACTELQLDMTEDKNRFPHDFKRWHDIRIDQYTSRKAELDEQKRKKLYAQFASIAEKYLALEKQNGREYVAIIAHSPAELMREGDILHHCVGRMNYDQKFVREETLIFFIRLKSAMDTPYVTVEYSLKNHKILQCYGENNHKPEEQVLHFINDLWLPHANKQLKLLAA